MQQNFFFIYLNHIMLIKQRRNLCGKFQGPPCVWCKFRQVFNGQLGHLYELGDWKTAESWPMLKLFWSESLKILLVAESQSDRVTDTQGMRVVEIFLCLISINFPTRFAHRGIRNILSGPKVNFLKETFNHCNDNKTAISNFQNQLI